MVKWRQLRRPIFNHRPAAFADEMQLSLTHSRDFLVIIQHLSETLVNRQTTGDSQGTRNTLSFRIQRDGSAREQCYLFPNYSPARTGFQRFFFSSHQKRPRSSFDKSKPTHLSIVRSIDRPWETAALQSTKSQDSSSVILSRKSVRESTFP